MKRTKLGKQGTVKGEVPRGSIKKKLLMRTIAPTVIDLLVAGILITIIAGSQIQSLESQNIKNCSLNAANQISEYFTRYIWNNIFK